MPKRPDPVDKKPKNYSWSKDLTGIRNLPTENVHELRRHKGYKDAIHLIRLIRKDHVEPGEYGYVQVFLGRILDNTFIPEEEYRRLYKRNGTLRVLPGGKSRPAGPVRAESSAKAVEQTEAGSGTLAAGEQESAPDRPQVTFTHPDGRTWDGHGELLGWVREAVERKDFLECCALTAAAKRAAPAKTNDRRPPEQMLIDLDYDPEPPAPALPDRTEFPGT